MLVGNIVDRFLEVFKSKHVPPLFFMSPFFAFMPYVKPLWQNPLNHGFTIDVREKLVALKQEMQASIKSEASKVSLHVWLLALCAAESLLTNLFFDAG